MDINKIINIGSQNKIKNNNYNSDHNKTFKNRYDYLIIETKCEFYSLVLYDSNDLLNIRNQKICQIKPKKLKFPIGTKLFVQNFNSERVVVNYHNKILDIYNIFSLDEPMLSYNLSEIYASNKNNFDIIHIFFYEKLIMILIREIDAYNIKENNEEEGE